MELLLSHRNKRNAPPPMMTIVRHSQHTDYQEEEEPMPYIPEKNAKDRIKVRLLLFSLF